MTEATGIRPLDPDDPDVRKLALIELALARGMPWTAIAAALQVKDKQEAKRVKAELERRVKAKQLAVADCEPQPLIAGICSSAAHAQDDRPPSGSRHPRHGARPRAAAAAPRSEPDP